MQSRDGDLPRVCNVEKKHSGALASWGTATTNLPIYFHLLLALLLADTPDNSG